MSTDGRLAKKRILVTGAASGIGRAAALALAREGAAVLAADVAGEVADTAAAIAEAGGTAVAEVADLAEPGRVAALVEQTVSALGGLDAVVANAGIVGPFAPLLDLEVEDWRRVLEVNLLATFACIKHGAAHMKDHGGGSIVCTASVAGLRAGAGPAPYSATKAALINLVRSAACQLGGTGVRVNCVCPGLIETAMTRPIFEGARAAGKEDRIGQLNPLRRAGQPEEIAEAIAFLASDAGSYVNGEALVVDGGLAASHPFVPGKMW